MASGTENLSAEDIKSIIDMIPTPEGVLDFLQRFGEKLGKGTSRIAYEYSPGKIIKIAFNNAGLLQNRNEIKFYDELVPYVPEIYDYHPEGYWIEMERVGKPKSRVIENMVSFVSRYDEPLQIILSNWDKFEQIKDEYFQFLEDFKEAKIKKRKLRRILGKLRVEIHQLKPNSQERIDLEDQFISIESQLKEIDSLIDHEYSERETQYNKLIHPDVSLLFERIFKSGLQKEKLKSFLDFSNKIIDAGISDLGIRNVGFSEKRGVPVLLDYGFEMSSMSKMYSKEEDEDFDIENYFSQNKQMQPRRMDTGRIKKKLGEQSKPKSVNPPGPRKEYIANSTVEEIKRIIEMIPTPEGILAFLEKFAEKLGEGSSRYAFDIAPDKVLKVAFNKTGLLQNKVEINAADELYPYVPEIYDHHPDGYWIEMEKVKAGEDAEIGEESIYWIGDLAQDISNYSITEYEVKEIYDNIENFRIMSELMSEISTIRRNGRDEKRAIELKNKLEDLEDQMGFEPTSDQIELFNIYIEEGHISYNSFIDAMRMGYAASDYGIKDIRADNIGRASDGRLVILDFGFDTGSEVASNYRNTRFADRPYDHRFRAEDYFKSTSDPNPAVYKRK